MSANIIVSNSPRHLRVTQTMVEDFLFDPVMAAKVILGYELDYFQAARLRYYWWVPDVMDLSGISSGKTIVDWAYLQLRCILLGAMMDHKAAIYYPTFATGQNEFWTYYTSCPGKIFRAELGRLDTEGEKTGKDTSHGSSCFKAFFRNGSQLLMPAGSFFQDAENQRSLRLNTLMVEEWPAVDDMGDGIDKQLLGRNTRANYNDNHPIWRNHNKLTAHAMPTAHKSQRRVRQWRKIANSGDPFTAVVTWSYKHLSDKPCHTGASFKKEFRKDHQMNLVANALSEAEQLGQLHGVDSVDGDGWYSSDILEPSIEMGRRLHLEPVCGRNEDKLATPHSYYFLGCDPAPAQGQKSCDGTLVVLRAQPKRFDPQTQLPVFSQEAADWDLALVYARRVRKASIDQWSGLIHQLHMAFQFVKIGMDGGGGGEWVKLKMNKVKQLILDIETTVTPIVTADDNTVVNGENKLILFSRADPMVKLVWPGMVGDDKMKETLNTLLRLAFEHREIAMPAPWWEWDKQVVASWPEQKQWALRLITETQQQLSKVVVPMDKEGIYLTTRNGCKQFISSDKMDFVSGYYFCYGAFTIWLKTADMTEDQGAHGESRFGGWTT